MLIASVVRHRSAGVSTVPGADGHSSPAPLSSSEGAAATTVMHAPEEQILAHDSRATGRVGMSPPTTSTANACLPAASVTHDQAGNLRLTWMLVGNLAAVLVLAAAMVWGVQAFKASKDPNTVSGKCFFGSLAESDHLYIMRSITRRYHTSLPASWWA